MKPRKLTLTNIGPFKGTKTIDFTALADMFLICGDTGAGKTTILDAICYALYGKLPGTNQPDERTLRSDFASADEEAEIVLEFSLQDDIYTVTRTPPMPYTNRNGKASEKPSEVKLVRHEQGGQFKTLGGKKEETDAYLRQLLGLSIDEFSKIVLLPQGDFATFLHLSSEERRKALSKLFPVNDYALVTARADAEYTKFKTELDAICNQLEELNNKKNIEDVKQDLQKISQKQEELLKEKELLQAQIVHFSRLSESAQKMRATMQKLNESKNFLQALEQKKDEMTNLAKQIEETDGAQKILAIYDAYKEVQKSANDAQNELNLCKAELLRAKELKENLQNQASVIAQKKVQNEELASLMQKYADAVNVVHDLKIAKQEKSAIFAQMDALQKEVFAMQENTKKLQDEIDELKFFTENFANISDEFNDVYAKLENAKKDKIDADNFLSAQKRYKDAKLALEKKLEEETNTKNAIIILKQEIETLKQQKDLQQKMHSAAILAKNLQDGTECPVCGATHHPKIAQNVAEDFSFDEKISAKDASLAQMQNAENQLAKTCASLVARKEEIAREWKDFAISIENDDGLAYAEKMSLLCKELANLTTEKRSTYDKATRASSKRKENEEKILRQNNLLLPKQEELDALKKSATQIDTKIAMLSSQVGALLSTLSDDKEFDEKNNAKLDENFIEEQAKMYQTQFDENNAQIEQFAKDESESIANFASLSAKNESLCAQVQKLQCQVQSKQAQFLQSLTDANIENEEKFISLLQNLPTLDAQKQSLNTYNKQCEETLNTIKNLTSEVESCDLKTLEGADDELKNVQQKANALDEDLHALVAEKTNALTTIEHWQELESKRKNLSQKSALYQKLANDLSGQNPKNISFESWILALYLEEIIANANVRLERISASRYVLLLKMDKSRGHQKKYGLDLEIFDKYTNRKRPCETLSGGETFLVSISLALALTDVVQSKSGGIQLDSLFIDEGFGTLDDETLERALSILDEIRLDRKIGLISHVGELRNRLASRIEVIKTQTGSSIKVF